MSRLHKEQLIAAFRRLKPRTDLGAEEQGLKIEITANLLAGIGSGSDKPLPPAFRKANNLAAIEQLKKTRELSRALSDQIIDFHAPTIQALANQGVLRDQLSDLAGKLQLLVEASSAARVPKPETHLRRGRRKSNRIAGIRNIVSNAYVHITGHNPTASGDFLRLSAEIIEILDLGVKPAGFARTAYDDFRAKRQSIDAMEKIASTR